MTLDDMYHAALTLVIGAMALRLAALIRGKHGLWIRTRWTRLTGWTRRYASHRLRLRLRLRHRRRFRFRFRQPPPPIPPACPVGPAQRAWIEKSVRWCAEQFGEEVARRAVAVPTLDFVPEQYVASDAQVRELFERVSGLMGVDAGRIDFALLDRLEDGSGNGLKSRSGGGPGSGPGSGPGGERRPSPDPGLGVGVGPDPPVRRTVGRYRRRDLRLRLLGLKLFWPGRGRIEVERGQAANPNMFVAIIAHELAHERLIGEGRVTTADPDHERLTDLLTVYFGLGVFTANAAWGFARSPRDRLHEPEPYAQEPGATLPAGAAPVRPAAVGAGRGQGRVRLGYLTAQEYGYVLACYCRLRGETGMPRWSRYLQPRLRAILKQGLGFIAAEQQVSEMPIESAKP